MPLSGGRVAHLTLDSRIQSYAESLLAGHHLPEAAVVLMDVASGKLIAYASHVERGPWRDLCSEARAPAASVFKLVTAAALIEAGLKPDRRECYSGGEQKITQLDLLADPKRDRWCTTLAGAVGRSINTVFGRLAVQVLTPESLAASAASLGFGAPLDFDLPVQTSALVIPDGSLAFARVAAGFWHTSLSPLHAAWLSATIARRGEALRPSIVADVVGEGGQVEWVPPRRARRALSPETASSLETMMATTVAYGTASRAFHDERGRPYLPHFAIAAKTGTLSDPSSKRLYTWFTGFVSGRPSTSDGGGVTPADAVTGEESASRVAIGVLVVNEPTWHVKASVVAREVLHEYLSRPPVLPGISMDSRKNRTAHAVHDPAQPSKIETQR